MRNIIVLARASQLLAHVFRPLLQTLCIGEPNVNIRAPLHPNCIGEPNVNIRAPLHLNRDGHNARKLVAPNLGADYARTTQRTLSLLELRPARAHDTTWELWPTA